ILGSVELKTGKVGNWSKGVSQGESLYRSPDGKRALAGREYGAWRQDDGGVAWGGRGTTIGGDLIDMASFKVIRTLDERSPQAKDRSIVGRYWSGDSKRIATVGSDHTVNIWESTNGTKVATLKGHKDWILDVAFSLDGKLLATASDDETGRVWESATGKLLHTLEGHTAGLNQVVFDATGEHILTAGEDETARLWDVTTGKQLRAWGQHESAVRSVGFEEEGKWIWTQTTDRVRRVWKVEDGSLLSEQKAASNEMYRYGVLYL